MRGRCEKKHGKGNCQKQGLIFYAKCKSGCNNIGLICRPKQPNCKKLGLGGQLDLSCAKKVRIGNPKTGICNSRQEEDAGLFYKNCKSGYDGDGPVCWADKPKVGSTAAWWLRRIPRRVRRSPSSRLRQSV
jgi:hypothetical protein|tara:strand:+ start:317 stop:709 length:393 start_codon:yes stop_codon:yes gene_type:complete